MPVEKSIEEVRTLIERELFEAEDDQKRCANYEDLFGAERFNSGRVHALKFVLGALESKPLDPKSVVQNAIADPSRAAIDEVQLHTYCGWRSTTVSELTDKIIAGLIDEGHITHESETA